MKLLRYFGIAMTLMFALGSSAAAQDVQTDHDKKADFSQYKTYYWEKVNTEDPLWKDRITDAVDKDLQAKGWQKVDSGGDVAVTAVGATKDEKQYETFYNGFGRGWWWRGFPGDTTTTVQNYKVGTLVLDMYDAQTKHLIWRGTATDMLSHKPSKNEKHLDKAVDKMFKDFPPKGKS